jgi:hypothetical protein
MSVTRSRLRKWTLCGGLAILVLLGIALLVPNDALITHRIAAHESSAVGHLRTIFQKHKEFRVAHDGGFADALSRLPDSTPSDRAYVYSLNVTARDMQGRVTEYLAIAAPYQPGKTGTRFFSVDERGTMHVESMQPVNSQSPVLE